MRIELIRRLIWLNESLIFYPKLKKSLLSLVESHGDLIFLDVGANRGQSIRYFRNWFPKAKIHCFEPHSLCFEILEADWGKVSGIFLNSKAVVGSKETGITDFFLAALDETSTFIIPKTNSRYEQFKRSILGVKSNMMYRKVQVETTTLDEYCSLNKLKKIDVLKIDVEGYELEVLKGSSTIMENGVVKLLVVEVHEDDLRLETRGEINRFLCDLGFKNVKRLRHGFGTFYDEVWIHSNPE